MENAYEDSFEDICNLWGGVQEIYDDTCKGNESNITIDRFGTDPPDELFRKQVDENIKEGLGNGRPIIRVLCEIPGRNGNLSEADRLINPFYLIRRLLNKYIVGLYSKIEIDEFNVCLGRDPDKGFPDFDLRKSRLGSTGKWHSQLIDRNLSGLFSADPEARGDYIRKRITFIKTLWDISSNLRGRRMMEILSKI